MNKKINKVVLSLILTAGVCSNSWADDPSEVTTSTNTTAMSATLQKLLTYFTNYGTYLGMDVTNAPSSTATFDLADLTSVGQALVFNSIYMNPLLGSVFANFNNPSASGTPGGPAIAVNNSVDEPFPTTTSNYAATPVSQAILNNLNSAMDEFNCYDPNCLTALATEQNIIGNDLLTQSPASARPITNLTQTALDQMNLDTLLAPMTYTTTSQTQGSGSPFGGAPPAAPGLPSSNQAQQANNFIRFLSGGVLPFTLPALTTFRTNLTTWQDTTQSQASRTSARQVVLGMAANLRTSATQLSVGVSNLYSAFTRRMPNPATANKSEVQVEYEMSTRRLFNPTPGSTAWQTQVETASTATLLREINYTLAEINYQLFLNRQMLERNMAATSAIVLEQQQFMRSMVSGDTGMAPTNFNIPIPQYTF